MYVSVCMMNLKVLYRDHSKYRIKPQKVIDSTILQHDGKLLM